MCEVRDYDVAAGLNSIGLQSAGGVGKIIAEWMRDGEPPMDLWSVDVRRNMPFQSNRKYLRERVTESLGLLYATHWPYRQYETSRNVRTSALHERLAARGACFGEAFGWERANWYAPQGVEPVYEYSYGRQNWFEHSAREHLGVRENVGLFDQSSFAKFRLEGRDALQVINQVSANDMDVNPGRLVYTQWLNTRGGIEADLTVTKLSEEAFMLMTATATAGHVEMWMRRHRQPDEFVVINDVTGGSVQLNIHGPKARQIQ